MKRSALIFALGSIFLLLFGSPVTSFAYSFGFEDFNTVDSTDYTYGRPNVGTSADPLTDFQGLYLGTVYDANDDVGVLLDFLANYVGLTVEGLTISGKTDEGTLWMLDTQEIAEHGIVSGTWQTYPGSAPSDPEVIDLIIVKGGKSFSVHQYDPAASSGEWNVGYLPEGNNDKPPSVSHVSAYYEQILPPTSVPEPATMLLLGAGLVGFASMRKRLRKR